MADDDKTEEPTGKKIDDARAEGNVAKSAEISGAIVLTFGTMYLLFFSSYSLIEIKKLMMFSYSFIGQELDGPLFYAITFHVTMTLLKALAPLFILILILVFVSNIAQFGFLSVPLKFDLQKLDPIKGIKGIFGLRKLIEALKLLAKLMLIMVVMFLLFALTYQKFLAMMSQDTQDTIATMFE